MYKSFCDDVYRIYTYNVDRNHGYPLFNGSRIHDGFRKRHAGFVKLQAFWIERDPFEIFVRAKEKRNYGKREKGGGERARIIICTKKKKKKEREKKGEKDSKNKSDEL